MIDNIIEQIVEIDKNARNKLDKALEERENILNQAKAEKEEMRKNLNERTNARINKVTEEENKRLGEQKNGALEKRKDLISAIDKSFSEKRNVWVNEIFNRMIGVNNV